MRGKRVQRTVGKGETAMGEAEQEEVNRDMGWTMATWGTTGHLPLFYLLVGPKP